MFKESHCYSFLSHISKFMVRIFLRIISGKRELALSTKLTVGTLSGNKWQRFIRVLGASQIRNTAKQYPEYSEEERKAEGSQVERYILEKNRFCILSPQVGPRLSSLDVLWSGQWNIFILRSFWRFHVCPGIDTQCIDIHLGIDARLESLKV